MALFLFAEGIIYVFPRQEIPAFGSMGPLGIETLAYKLRYHHIPSFSEVKSPLTVLDPLLGWRSLRPFSPIERKARCTLNAQGWRSRYNYEIKKTKTRIIVTGDSILNYGMLDDEEIITHFLQKDLGDNVEVLNMASPGYGIDQMALVATRIAPAYEPDILVVGIIQDDLWRGCTDRFFGSLKPYFELNRGELQLKGVPVPTPELDIAAHQNTWSHVKDAFVTWTTRSRVVSLLGDGFLLPISQRCEAERNTALLNLISKSISPRTRLVVAYFEGGELPPKMKNALAHLPLTYVDVRFEKDRVSKEMNLVGSRLPLDNHPDPNLNRIYARVLAQTISPLFNDGKRVGNERGVSARRSYKERQEGKALHSK